MHVAHNVFETMGPSSPHFASMRDDMNRSLAWMSILALPDWGAQHVRTRVELVGDVLEAWEVCQILSLDDPHYPPALAQIPDPPPVLFILGSTFQGIHQTCASRNDTDCRSNCSGGL